MEWKTGTPNKSGWYMVTITADDVKYTWQLYYNKRQKCWYHDGEDTEGNPKKYPNPQHITAWSKMPKPF